MSYFPTQEKNQSTVYSSTTYSTPVLTPNTPYTPYSNAPEPYDAPRHPGYGPLGEVEKIDKVCPQALLKASPDNRSQKYKRLIRILRFVSRILSLILNALIAGIEAFSLVKFFLTRNHLLSNGQSPYPTPTVLWPTFMLLSIALTTFLVNLITLVSYICSSKAANRASTMASVVTYVLLGVRVVVWASAAGLFKMAETGNDLWGYSCSDAADKIADEVQSFVDFGQLCTVQVCLPLYFSLIWTIKLTIRKGISWNVTIIEAGIALLTLIIAILTIRRMSTKKKMGRMREAGETPTMGGGGIYTVNEGYGNTMSHEMGNIYAPGVGRQYMPLSGGAQGL